MTGALAFLVGSKARAADAARATTDAPAGSGAVVIDVPVLVVVLTVAVAEAEVLVSLLERLAATVTVVEAALAGALLAVAGAAVTCSTEVGVTLRVNQKMPAPIAIDAIPIHAQGVEDLFCRAEGGNVVGWASGGIGRARPGAAAFCSDVFSVPVSDVENCVDANCVLAPYSESL